MIVGGRQRTTLLQVGVSGGSEKAARKGKAKKKTKR